MLRWRLAAGRLMETPDSGCYILGLSSGDEHFLAFDFR
jgi:hypothetical protein